MHGGDAWSEKLTFAQQHYLQAQAFHTAMPAREPASPAFPAAHPRPPWLPSALRSTSNTAQTWSILPRPAALRYTDGLPPSLPACVRSSAAPLS